MTHDAAREAVAQLILGETEDLYTVTALDLTDRILAKLAELGFVDAGRLTSEAAATAANDACQDYDGGDGGGLYGDMKAAITAAIAVAKGEK